MLTCPACNDALVRTQDAGDPQWICARCRARALPLGALARIATQEFGRALRQEIDQGMARAGVKCPSCGRAMRELEVPIKTGVATVELCTSCRLVWLDAEEVEQLPRKLRYEPSAAVDPVEIKRTLARAEVELETARERRRFRGGLEDMTGMQRILSLIGMPVDVDAPEGERPWCTWSVGALLVVVFLFELIDLKAVIQALAWIPAQPFRLGGLTLLTSFFLHAGWLHLIGNVYFLIAFGSGVERRLGAGRMVLLLAVAAIVGAVTHALFDPRSEIPYIGASGGLSALILFYAATYPWNRFAVTIWLFIVPRTFSVAAVIWASLWFAWQALNAFIQHYGGGDVSALAHFGGALTGLAAFLLWRKRADTNRVQ